MKGFAARTGMCHEAEVNEVKRACRNDHRLDNDVILWIAWRPVLA